MTLYELYAFNFVPQLLSFIKTLKDNDCPLPLPIFRLHTLGLQYIFHMIQLIKNVCPRLNSETVFPHMFILTILLLYLRIFCGVKLLSVLSKAIIPSIRTTNSKRAHLSCPGHAYASTQTSTP